MNPHTMRIVNWNVQWAQQGTDRGHAVLKRVFHDHPDVICLTEADRGLLPEDGFVITSDADYGYNSPHWKRKVVLWSRTPWTKVDSNGNSTLPGGRFVAATTKTPIGPVRFFGLCIPWFGAHVTHGRKDRKRWEDHLLFLEGLQEIFATIVGPAVALGDFNQTVPRTRAPHAAFELLTQLFDDEFPIVTGGELSGIDRETIDHVALSKELAATQIQGIDRHHPELGRLSDHCGVMIEVGAAKS